MTAAVTRKKHAWVLVLGCLMVAPVAAQTVERDPDRPWIATADSLTAVGDLEKASRVYRDLTQRHPQDAPLWMRLAVVDLQLGRAGSALEAAQTAAELDPDDPDVYLVLAQTEAASGDRNLGANTLEAGLARHPDHLPLLSGLAQVSVELGDHARAAGLLRQLMRLDPANGEIQLDLIRLLITSGDYPAAAREIVGATNDGGDPAVLYALLGKTQLLSGAVEDATASFQRALGERPTAEALGGLGAIHFLRGEPGRAITRLREALELDPSDPDLWFNLGNALSRTERFEEAEDAYRRSLALDPRAASTHVNLGVMLLRRLDVAEARRHLEAAFRLDPTLPTPHLHLARIHAASYRYDDALRHYRDYAELSPDANEAARIQEVIGDLQARRDEAAAARARGEIHLLQARLATRDQAEEFAQRVREGEDFYSLAAQLSEVAEVAGVDAGFLDPGSLADTFGKELTSLRVGGITPPLPGPSGFFVFQRVE